MSRRDRRGERLWGSRERNSNDVHCESQGACGCNFPYARRFWSGGGAALAEDLVGAAQTTDTPETAQTQETAQAQETTSDTATNGVATVTENQGAAQEAATEDTTDEKPVATEDGETTQDEVSDATSSSDAEKPAADEAAATDETTTDEATKTLASSKPTTDAAETDASYTDAAVDDGGLVPMVAEYYDYERDRETGTVDSNAIDESDITEWETVDADAVMQEYAGDRHYYSVDEDGFRMYYMTLTEEGGKKHEQLVARFKIFKDGEEEVLKAPAKGEYALTTDHTAGPLFSSEFFKSYLEGKRAFEPDKETRSYIVTDDPNSVFTPGIEHIRYGTDYVDPTDYYYYAGGPYGAAGWYYLVKEASGPGRAGYYEKFVGMYALATPSGGLPEGGLDLQGDSSNPAISASYSGYEPGAMTVTPATGSSYVPSTAVAAIPATSDVTSFAGAAAAAISALGALGLGTVIRRK